MAQTVEQLLQKDTALAGLAEHNISWAASGCPAISLSAFDGKQSFPAPGHSVQFIRVACVAPSFAHAMSMTRRVREVLGAMPEIFHVGGAADEVDRIHTISTDFEVWTKPE